MKQKILDNSKVSESGCWEWQRSRLPSGYGRVSVGNGKQGYAHRESYKAFKGMIPKGHVIRHTCDNTRCCNPEHLLTGTHKDNMQDALSRSRMKEMLTTERTRGVNNVKAKLSEPDVVDIYMSKETGVTLAAKFNVTTTLISMIRRGKIWHHVTSTLVNT